MVIHLDHPLPSAPYQHTHPLPRYDTNTRQLHRPSHPGYRLLDDGKAWHWVLYMADPFDLTKFTKLPDSSEKDAGRKQESAVAAAGHLVPSSSAAAHISGAILYNSSCCELVQALNLSCGKMAIVLDTIFYL